MLEYKPFEIQVSVDEPQGSQMKLGESLIEDYIVYAGFPLKIQKRINELHAEGYVLKFVASVVTENRASYLHYYERAFIPQQEEDEIY